MPNNPECDHNAYQGFFQNATCGICRSSEDGRFLVANPAMADMLGFESPEALVRGVKNIDEELFLGTGEYQQLFSDARQGREPVTGEFQLFCNDGSTIWVSVKAHYVENESGQGVLEGYLTEITEQKRGEWLLKEKEELYRGVYDYSTEGLFQCTPAGRLVSGSPSLARCFGFENFEQLSGTYQEFKDLLENPRAFSDFAHRLEKNGVVERFESKARKNDGQAMWVSINARVQKDAEGLPILFQGSLHEITGRKDAERRLHYQSVHDTLTGLMNRGMFVYHLDKALARMARNKDYSFAVIFADLDRFRIINDSLGYEIGDKVLIELARRLGGALRDEDALSRFGSDKFGIFVEGATLAVDAIRVAERLLGVLEKPIVIEEHEVFLTLSMGIALSSDSGGDSGKLLADAEQAMTRAKKNPHLRYVVLDDTMQNVALERLCLETDLRKGMDREEFMMFYQPIVDLKTGDVVALEALMRWCHPIRKLVSPSEFIPVAEETGLIIPLGFMALRQACAQMQEWTQRLKFNPPKVVAVNLSAKQFMKADLMEDVKRVLAETGLDGKQLKLEVTESAFMANPQTAKELLSRLKELGVFIVIDDFGTGYSSLSYLKHLPSDILKIDRSFVSDIEISADNKAISETIIALAKSLGLAVVAEGIEKEEHWRILAAMGCDLGQGFFFSPPVEAKKAEALLYKRYNLK